MKRQVPAFLGIAFLLGPLRAQVVQSEPNDSIGTATPSTLTAGSSGGVRSEGNNGDGPFGPTTGDGTGDFDFFSIEAAAGQTIVFDVRSGLLGSGLDTVIGLYNSAGVLVASNDDDGVSRDSFLRHVATATETYYAVVGNWIPGAADDAGSLPTDPNTPGTGRGAPGAEVGDYEVVLLLDGPAYFTHTVPAFPLSEPNTAVTGEVTLLNEGSSAATITALELSGPGAAAYAVNETLPLTVAAGASATISIEFDPGGSDARQEAVLTVVSDDIINPRLELDLEAKALAGLLFRLAFDDPPGTAIASFAAPEDISGNEYPAAYIVNAGAPPFGFGRPPLAGTEGTSVMFNDAGSSGNFVLTLDSFPHTASVSYSLWVRPTAGVGEDSLFNRDPGFGLGDAIYGCNIAVDGTVSFRIAGVGIVASPAGAVPDDSTHHIVVTHLDDTGFGDAQAERTRLYIDGELVAENTNTIEFPEYSGGSNSRLWIGTRSAAGTGFNGDMDDFQLYNIELTPADVAGLFANPGSVLGEGPRTEFGITKSGSDLVFRWESEPGKLYNLRSESDPTASERGTWPIHEGNADMAATPPENSLTIPLPADPFRLFVIEEFDPPPVVVFSENFDLGQGAWTTGVVGDPATTWELGTPENVGPAAAQSPPSCFGTNIAADYGVNGEVWLRSPAIDLTTAAEATLKFFHFVDIEVMFDEGRVAILDAADDSELAVVDSAIDGSGGDWKEFSKSIPGEALGKNIKVEFRFTSDDFNELAGWYIDDVSVTVP